MKSWLGLALALLACVLSAAAQPVRTVDSLGWLTGRWVFEKNGRLVQEEWMAPAGGTMLGMSRTVKDGKMREYEFVLLRADAAGDIFYVVTPSGQATTEFKLIESAERSVVFENKANDFPQRVGYTLNADGSLTAYIEGTVDEKNKRIEYPYRRAE